MTRADRIARDVVDYLIETDHIACNENEFVASCYCAAEIAVAKALPPDKPPEDAPDCPVLPLTRPDVEYEGADRFHAFPDRAQEWISNAQEWIWWFVRRDHPGVGGDLYAVLRTRYAETKPAEDAERSEP